MAHGGKITVCTVKIYSIGYAVYLMLCKCTKPVLSTDVWRLYSHAHAPLFVSFGAHEAAAVGVTVGRHDPGAEVAEGAEFFYYTFLSLSFL